MSSESIEVEFSPIGAVRGEAKILVGIQRALINRPGAVSAARGLSHFGEHSLGWLAIAGAGVAVSAARGDIEGRNRWAMAGVGAFGAHAASVVIKRVVRRKRPHHPDITIGVSTPSKLSFPSSHATSTTAAAILIGRAAGFDRTVLPAVIVPPMLMSRLVLGVHYPTDVIGGALIGATCAAALTTGERLIRTENRGVQ